MVRQHLVFDADDTLWENNIYFEDAFDKFCAYLSHSSMTPEQVRAVLDEIEIVNAKIHGYGSKNFARNLGQCFQHLAEREISDARSGSVWRSSLTTFSSKPPVLIAGRRRDAAPRCGAPRTDTVYQGRSGRTAHEGRPLRAGGLFRSRQPS